MPEALDRLERRMRYLEKNSSSQTECLKQLTEMRGWLPTRRQVDELTKAVTELRWAVEQVWSRNEKSFSLPKLRLPRLRFPRLADPTWVVLLMSLAALLLLWWGLGGVWNDLNLLLR